MARADLRYVRWVGNRTLYDTATETALRDHLAARGWVVDTTEASLCRGFDPFSLIHCWDITSVSTWLPMLCVAREAGIVAVLSPAYDEEYIAQSQHQTLNPESPTPFPDAATAWRFTRTQQTFALSQIQMLLPTAHAELDAIHHAFPQTDRIPSTIIPACLADNPLPNAIIPELQDVGPYVLCVAPISPVYGQDEIIRAARKAMLVPVMIGMASRGDVKYEEHCRELAPETIWLPALSAHQLTAAIGRARIVVHSARDVIVPLLAARLGVCVVLPATHYVREYMQGALIPYRRSDPASLDRALHAAIAGVSPMIPDIDLAHPVDIAALALVETYDALTAMAPHRSASREGEYVRFLEAELIREYRTNQMPDTMIAILEAEVAWYRRIAEGGVLWRELRRLEAELAAETARARQLDDRAAHLAEEAQWRQQAMGELTAELNRRQALFEARARAGLFRVCQRVRQVLRPRA